MYIPPMVIFKGLRILGTHKQDFPAGSAVGTTLSGYINEAAFLEYLQNFKKYHTAGKCPLNLHTYYYPLETLNYFQ